MLLRRKKVWAGWYIWSRKEEEHYERDKARVEIVIAVHFNMRRKRKKLLEVDEKERLGDPIGDSLWSNNSTSRGLLFIAVIISV